MKALTEPLRESADYQNIIERLTPAAGAVVAEGCVPSQKWHLVDAVSHDPALSQCARSRVIVTYSDKGARDIADEYRFYDRNTVLFPGKDLIFYQADLRGREIETQRLRCLRRILEGRPVTVVTTLAALMTPLVPLRDLQRAILRIDKRTEITEEEIAEQLVLMGYEKNYQVDSPGQFAIRGDIIDIFDLTEENPYRIELFGDEVDSIRSFDIESQRSIEQLEMIRIYPASEMILTGRRLDDGLARMRQEMEETAAKFRAELHAEAAHRLTETVSAAIEHAEEYHDYEALESYIHYFYPATGNLLGLFSQDNTMLFLDEPQHLWEEATAVETEFRESMISRSEQGYVLPGQMALIMSADAAIDGTRSFRRLSLASLLTTNNVIADQDIISIHARSAAPYNKSMDALQTDLTHYRRDHYRVVIISASRTRAKRLAQDLTARGLPGFYSENPDRAPEPGEIMTYYGRVGHGFEYPLLKFIVIAETDIFGAEPRKKKRKKFEGGEVIRDFTDLHVGDYVVHEDHGIGIYQGVEKVELDGTAQDYIKIEYGGNDILYVLPTELSALQKYASQEAARPRLNRLGTQEWNNTKSKVKGAVEEVAQDLVELYAKRAREQGHAFSPDTPWQQEFEELFPYEETEDQLQAIADTKRDMESGRIMDRLICGDVGYGKTEIAIRAAFKAAQDGYQTAVLVPTTILAQQHYNTFTERMKDYPVRVGLLSRFRTAAEQKRTLQDLQTGLIDVLIGTHRILSKDVKFKNLGLLVVDEEQRFGVTHKEKIKKLRENVDVLTLTATPIPRTLHMSLVGIRDMSILEEAPGERMPIQTYVMEYNEEMVREAVLRELSRGGQVYYVYNRVNDIAEVAARLQDRIPEARIGYAHGQMSEAELERIMYEFIGGSIDVLVSTTIIETGLDISNVNTIIIHDSDRMGLSQLYQLRGRVGRSNRAAYAFLMYKKDRMLKEDAEKRLAAIKEFTDLGSGFRIAMRDLEIRGAGAVLGRAQHGHMAAVGYDLYCKLLDSAVRKAKGEEIPEERRITVNLPASAFIPASYIVNEVQKLDIYKRIAAIDCVESCDDVRDELRDRFGETIPAPAENLLRIALIRCTAGRLDIVDIAGGKDALGNATIRFTMDPKAAIAVQNIPRLLAKYGKTIQFNAKGALKGDLQGRPYFEITFKPSGITVKDEETTLTLTETFLIDYQTILR